jgi:hypothetical protein
VNQHSFEIEEPLEDFVAIRRANGSWLDRASRMPLPGARDITAAEFLGPNADFHSEEGEWVDVPGDVAASRHQILQWCREHASSGSSATRFRFERKVFEEAGRQTIPIAYVPELDDPHGYVQRLARTERELRAAKKTLDGLERKRAQRLRVAAENGLSRRVLADLVGLSFARVQQLIAREERSA